MTSVEDTTTVPVPVPNDSVANDSVANDTVPDSIAVCDSRLLGQVKWFNNKVGYGFITVNDGEFSGKDIFIHYSAIRVTNSQYKYLVQGEYVEFTLVKSTMDTHEFQAVDISGIKGGALMCETRRINRPLRDSGDTGSANAPDSSYIPNQRPQRRYRTNGLGNNGDSKPAQAPSNEGGEFTSVRRRRPQQGDRSRGPRKQQNAPVTA
jgi:cold shock CspA family protein